MCVISCYLDQNIVLESVYVTVGVCIKQSKPGVNITLDKKKEKLTFSKKQKKQLELLYLCHKHIYILVHIDIITNSSTQSA